MNSLMKLTWGKQIFLFKCEQIHVFTIEVELKDNKF